MSNILKLIADGERITEKIKKKLNVPNEVLAVAAKCWMLEEPWGELVIFDNCDILLLKSSLPSPQHRSVHFTLFICNLLLTLCHVWNSKAPGAVRPNFGFLKQNIFEAFSIQTTLPTAVFPLASSSSFRPPESDANWESVCTTVYNNRHDQLICEITISY